jgi:hypothetical protein
MWRERVEVSRTWGHGPPSTTRVNPIGRFRAIWSEGQHLGGHLKTGHRSTRQNRPPRAASETGVEFYRTVSSDRKSMCTFVRQLRGPHLSTCA